MANQEANRPSGFNRKVDTWAITINGSELREVGIAEAIRGDALTWKLAMWGSYRDRRLLESIEARFMDETLVELLPRRRLDGPRGLPTQEERQACAGTR